METIDTEDLEQSIMQLCVEYMNGKSTMEGLAGPVQAVARTFLFQTLTMFKALQANNTFLDREFSEFIATICRTEFNWVEKNCHIEFKIHLDS